MTKIKKEPIYFSVKLNSLSQMNEAGEIKQGNKKIANLATGRPEHEGEYIFTIHASPSSEAEDLPSSWEREIQDSLGERWGVKDRGGRIEITPPGLIVNDDNTKKLRSALEGILGSRYNLQESGE